MTEEVGKLTFPILPDSDPGSIEDGISPHADGHPWKKACSVCAFRRHDPQGLGSQYQEHLRTGTPDTVFYCIHREDGEGYHRICACYAALHPEQAISKLEGEPS